MTTEEYQKNLVRMWDSVRNKSKGEETCRDVNCRDCHFDEICNAVYGGTIFNACETIEIVEQWAKEHPIKTNADKFREVFGTKPSLYTCVNDINCEDCKYYGDVCYVRELFWDAEYKEQTEE